jgi:hypothetical protein
MIRRALRDLAIVAIGAVVFSALYAALSLLIRGEVPWR